MGETKECVDSTGDLHPSCKDAFEPGKNLLITNSSIKMQVVGIFIGELNPQEIVVVIRILSQNSIQRFHFRTVEGDTRRRHIDPVDIGQVLARFLERPSVNEALAHLFGITQDGCHERFDSVVILFSMMWSRLDDGIEQPPDCIEWNRRLSFRLPCRKQAAQFSAQFSDPCRVKNRIVHKSLQLEQDRKREGIVLGILG